MSRKQSNCSPDHDRYLEPLESRTLLAAGDPDPSFGSLGVASFNFPGAEFIIHDVALQSNGKVIAVGTKGGNLAVVRLSASGLLDGSFGTGGLFESGRRTRATSVAIQPDDKILITFGPGSIDVNLAVGRLTANGSGFDSSFGSSGIAFVNDFSRDSGNAVTLQQDGKIVVAGLGGRQPHDNIGLCPFHTVG